MLKNQKSPWGRFAHPPRAIFGTCLFDTSLPPNMLMPQALFDVTKTASVRGGIL